MARSRKVEVTEGEREEPPFEASFRIKDGAEVDGEPVNSVSTGSIFVDAGATVVVTNQGDAHRLRQHPFLEEV